MRSYLNYLKLFFNNSNNIIIYISICKVSMISGKIIGINFSSKLKTTVNCQVSIDFQNELPFPAVSSYLSQYVLRTNKPDSLWGIMSYLNHLLKGDYIMWLVISHDYSKLGSNEFHNSLKNFKSHILRKEP